MYTVKQVADLAGISVRTLHYYDEIGLFAPAQVGDNGYRYYDDESLLRLQQILFFRELDFPLDAIKAILDQPEFDLLAALQTHRHALQDRVERLNALIHTVDRTILFLTGDRDMSQKQFFDGFSAEDEERYRLEAREKYGAEEVDASTKRWNSYAPEKQAAIKAEGGAIYTDLAGMVGQDASSPAVQAVIARWHQHMRYFYEPSVERLEGLGQLYVESPDFAEGFRALHPDLPEFMRQAITHYCAGLRQGD